MTKPCCPNNECPHRDKISSKIVRHGYFNVQCGHRRRYRCLACGGTFSNRIGSAYFRLRCSAVTFDRVAMMSVEGMSRSAIARVEGVSWHTADRWISKASDYAHLFNDQIINGVELIELQADELKTLLTTKAQAIWIFTSMEVNSRLWLSTVVGRRSYRNTHRLFTDTLNRIEVKVKPLITTDGFTFYERVIRKLLGVACDTV